MENRRPLIRRRWDPFVNQSGETIPPWSCMRMEQTLEGLYAYKPNEETNQQVMFNGPMPVVSGGSGLATFDEPIEAAFNTDEGPPLVGEEWGPVDGEWRLGAGGVGFACLGQSEESRAMFLATAGEEFADILRIVTNVCDVGESTGNVFAADDAYVINSTGGQAVVVGEVEAQEGFITVRGVLDWSDPGYEATTGDSFSFYLVANGSNHTGAPKLLVTFVGDAATNQKEMVWKIAAEPGSTVALQLWAYRVAGSGQLTAAVTSRLEVQTAVAGKKVEYRQLILNGAHVGPKICVMNPTDCCVDDDASTQDGTASDLITNCCSVPIPAMRVVDLTGVEAHLPGWWGVWQGAWNFDTLIQTIADELNKVHYLPYMGTVTNSRIRCVYGKNISIPGAFGLSAEGYWQPSGPPIGATSTVYYPTFNIQIRFYISERLAGESSQFFDYTPTPPYGNPAGYIDAPEYQAHCALGVGLYTDEGPWNGPFLVYFNAQPHYTRAFHATQNTLLGNEVLTPYSNTLPDPGSSCAGPCNLWSPTGPFQTTEPVTFPWKVTVDPV